MPSIEIFTKEGSKQVVLPSSSIYSNAMEQDYHYKVISDINKLSDIATVNNIHEVVKETMLANGYGYNEELLNSSNKRKRKSRKTKTSAGTKQKLKRLNDKEVTKVVELTVPIFEAIEGAKHEGTLALGGFFSYHISKNSSRKIASGIVEKIGSIFDNAEAFKKTLLVSYERPIEEKAGLPTLLDLIEDLDSTFNTAKFSEELNLICNRNFRKEKVTSATFKVEVATEEKTTTKEIKVPVYLYETEYSKYLKYEGIVEGIDLTLDFNSLIGSFIYTKTGKELDSFKFKFKNRFLEITKIKELTEFLAEEEIVLPKNFEKQLRRHIKNLDKSITKPKVIEEDITKPIEEDVPEDVVLFGVTESTYYEQSEKKGIVLKIVTNKGIITKPIANVVIEEVEIILDSLGILEPVYNVKYFNKTFNKEITVEYLTKKQLTEEFIKANVFYISTKENVETVLNAFIIDGTKEERILTKTEAYLEGFFVVDGKVVENTKLKNLKKYTPEDVAEAINLLNEIMKDRSEEGKANDSTVYRFSLWNPYSYCLKQIGYKTGIYSLILIGKTKGNKTGAYLLGNLFYLNTEEENSGSTVSVLGSMLGLNSFSKGFDECYNLIVQPEAPDVMKKSTQDKTVRITKNRTDNTEMDRFNAFGLPVFLLNERYEFKDFIRERYKIRDYTSKSYISKTDRKKFNEKYLPEAEDTILKKLALIGNEFKKKIVPLIEAKDKKLFNPEELTIDILKEIAEETSKATGKEVDFLPEMYKITEDSTNYNYDVAKAIVEVLNEEFKKKNKIQGTNKIYYNVFVNSVVKNDFKFIIYNRSRSKFLIVAKEFENYINNNVEETVELDTILESLDLKELLEAEAKSNKTNYEDYIRKQNKINGKNKRGFYLNVETLANKLFSFDLSEEEESKENS